MRTEQEVANFSHTYEDVHSDINSAEEELENAVVMYHDGTFTIQLNDDVKYHVSYAEQDDVRYRKTE